jgi:plasmid stabilization system protein ParE
LAEVVWTEEAERWLLKIHDYIAKDGPAAAFNVVQSIYARAQVLGRFPDLGHSYTSPSGREARILLWGHYRIVYLKRSKEEVHIVGVFHGAMDLDQYLK